MNECGKTYREEVKKKLDAEIRIPDTFLNEIRVSEEVADIVLIDREIAVGDYDWFVVNKKSNVLSGLADVYEEHDTYILLGYKKWGEVLESGLKMLSFLFTLTK